MMNRAVLAVCLVAFATPALAGTILGRVAATGGAGISGAQVLGYSLGAKGWTVVATTLTNGSGDYSMTLPAGDYLVRALGSNITTQCLLAQRYYDAVAPFSVGVLEDDADVLVLGAATVITGINMTLPTVGGIDGRVTQGGVGINGIQVRVEETSDPRIHVDTTTFVSGGVSGSYSACGLDPGSYRIWTHSPAAQYEDLVAPGPFFIVAGSRLALGNLNLVNIGSDPNEPNPNTVTSTSVPTFVDTWQATGAIITPRGSDVDFYCLNAVVGDRFVVTSDTTVLVSGEPRTSPWVDPQLGWYSAAPLQLLVVNDDDPLLARSLNARIDTGAVTADGRYCVAVTSFGDPDFNGTGQASAGRYGLRIATDAMFADGFE